MKVFLMLLLCLFASGCSYFVPGSVKRQVGLMKTDVSTALKEVNELSGDEAKKKAMLTLQRLDKGLLVVDDYVSGRKATR
jgi:hypothetical protein